MLTDPYYDGYVSYFARCWQVAGLKYSDKEYKLFFRGALTACFEHRGVKF